MSDAKDAVGKALALNRQLAGSKLARKQELEADLAKLERERADMIDAPELDAAIAAVGEELAVVAAELKSALAEIDELRKLGSGIDAGVARAQVNAVLNPDPFIQTPEQAALDRAREHIGSLDAQVRLSDELADKPARATPPSAADADADADARAAFEALRAGRGQNPDAPRPPSKKTL